MSVTDLSCGPCNTTAAWRSVDEEADGDRVGDVAACGGKGELEGLVEDRGWLGRDDVELVVIPEVPEGV